jgi:hypothetical protein
MQKGDVVAVHGVVETKPVLPKNEVAAAYNIVEVEHVRPGDE